MLTCKEGPLGVVREACVLGKAQRASTQGHPHFSNPGDGSTLTIRGSGKDGRKEWGPGESDLKLKGGRGADPDTRADVTNQGSRAELDLVLPGLMA